MIYVCLLYTFWLQLVVLLIFCKDVYCLLSCMHQIETFTHVMNLGKRILEMSKK